MNAISQEVIRRLDNLDPQAMANLIDSVPSCAEDLGKRLAPVLDFFVAGMPSSLDGWRDGRTFTNLLQQVAVDNFGIVGTSAVLQRLGIGQAPVSFLQRAHHRVTQVLQEADVRKDTFGLIHKRVLCYAEWDVITSSGESIRGALLRENGIRVGHTEPPAWLRSFPTPINYMIGRDLCGEFQLVTGMALVLDAVSPGRLQGSATIFSSCTPCVSCVAVLRQFHLRFPELQVTFANGEQHPDLFQ